MLDLYLGFLVGLPATADEPGFVGSNLGLMFQREPDFIEPFEQAGATEVVDLEACFEILVVADSLIQQRDMKFVASSLVRAIEQCRDLLFVQSYEQQSVVAGVGRKDIGESGRDNHAKAEIR